MLGGEGEGLRSNLLTRANFGIVINGARRTPGVVDVGLDSMCVKLKEVEVLQC